MSTVLQSALAAKEAARASYKTRHLAGGHSSKPARLSAREKHRRRLAKNQASSAAARHARAAYTGALEDAVSAAETEQALLSLEAARMRAQRDALAARVHDLQTQLAGRLPDAGEEFAREYEEACDTQRLLASLSHLPQFRMTPQAFAVAVMGVPTCPAL